MTMIVGMMSLMRRKIPAWDLFETQDGKDEDLPPSSLSEPAQIGTRRQRQRCVQAGSGLRVRLKIDD